MYRAVIRPATCSLWSAVAVMANVAETTFIMVSNEDKLIRFERGVISRTSHDGEDRYTIYRDIGRDRTLLK